MCEFVRDALYADLIIVRGPRPPLPTGAVGRDERASAQKAN